MLWRQPILKVSLLSFLEGSADRFGACSGAAGTNGDLLGCAISVAVVMHAILYVAANALDVLLAAAFLGSVVLIHFLESSFVVILILFTQIANLCALRAERRPCGGLCYFRSAS